MNNFTKINIKDIPIEQAHGGSGSRQVLVKPEHVSSRYFEAMTKGFLKPGNLKHKIEAGGKLTSEYYFIRLRRNNSNTLLIFDFV